MREIDLEQDFEINSVDFQDQEPIYHVPLDYVIDKILADGVDVDCAEKSNSDLVPGIYEGGAKIWECTHDLGEYLIKTDENNDCILDDFKNKVVLDLGCGAGILGLLALQRAKCVHFQDYVSASIHRLYQAIQLISISIAEQNSLTTYHNRQCLTQSR